MTFAILGTALLSGCVAMSIPSVRYHDPDDRGGMLGPQRPADPADVVRASGEHAAFVDGEVASTCLNCGDDGQCDGQCDGSESEKPPEVPWPRFHPLPTRPVFSPPQL